MNSSDITGIIRFWLNFFTDTPYVNIHRTRRHETAIPPNGIQQLIACKNMSRISGHEFQKAKLSRGSGHFLVVNAKDPGAGIDLQVIEFKYWIRWRYLSSAQYGAYPCHQFPGAEWLRDVVVSTEVQTTYPVSFCDLRSHEDNGGLRKLR